MKKKGAYKIPYRRVEVVWDDAASNSEQWVDIDEIDRPERVNTTGWLVLDKAEYITVASSVSADGRGENNVGNTMTIPRGMIISIKEVNVTRSKPQHQVHPEPGAETVHREQSQS